MDSIIGKIVFYTLTADNVEVINRRRQHAKEHVSEHIAGANGVMVHFGNEVREGNVFPMIIVKDWGDGLVNGQVFLDGSDTLWVQSVRSRCVLMA
jgi:hypothetical protein